MSWNPSPKVADCREIAEKWKKHQVIILAIGYDGQFEMATFGQTRMLCAEAKLLGDVAFEAIEAFVQNNQKGSLRRR